MNDDEEPNVAVAEEAADRPLVEDVRTLYADGMALAGAEVAFQKARAGFAASQIKSILLLGVGALVLLHFALVALTVGAVISLAPLIGAIGATLVVTGVLLLLSVISVLMALRHWRGMVAVLSDRKGA